MADGDMKNLGPDTVLGFKRIELDKIYNPSLSGHLGEIQRKKVADGSRIVLNPHPAELEILMGEMIKKKIMAKDRILRELDSVITENRENGNELEHLKSQYLQLSNDNNALSGKLEQLRSNYLRNKEHKKIEQESLRTQISNIESLINRRDVDHRGLMDKLNNEHRMQLRDVSQDWEEKVRYLEQKIKGMGIDKDRMEKELIILSNKVTSARENFTVELANRKEDTVMEAKARADHTARILETRLLSLQEGAEMMQRRGLDQLREYQIEEQKIFDQIASLNQQKLKAEEENRKFDMAIQDVRQHNEKIQHEADYVSGHIKKLSNEVLQLTEAINKRNQVLKDNLQEAVKKYTLDEVGIESEKKEQDRKIQELELRLKDLNSQISQSESKRSYFVELANRNVSKVIYDTLINRNYIDA